MDFEIVTSVMKKRQMFKQSGNGKSLHVYH